MNFVNRIWIFKVGTKLLRLSVPTAVTLICSHEYQPVNVCRKAENLTEILRNISGKRPEYPRIVLFGISERHFFGIFLQKDTRRKILMRKNLKGLEKVSTEFFQRLKGSTIAKIFQVTAQDDLKFIPYKILQDKQFFYNLARYSYPIISYKILAKLFA